jgi:hypothetical protein
MSSQAVLGRGDSIIFRAVPRGGDGMIFEPFGGRRHRYQAGLRETVEITSLPSGSDVVGIIPQPSSGETTSSFPRRTEGRRRRRFRDVVGEDTASFPSRTEGRRRPHFRAVLGEPVPATSPSEGDSGDDTRGDGIISRPFLREGDGIVSEPF